MKKKLTNNKQNRITKGLKFFVLMILLSVATSCRKFVEIAPPENQIIASQVFTSDITATAAVTGLYSQMMASALYLINGGMTVYPGLSADELYNTTTSTTLDPFTTNTLLPNSTIISNNLWRNAYIFIYQANACIDGLNQSTSLTPTVKTQLLGEVKFIRALNNFYLVNLFGDVPLVVSTDYTVNEIMPRIASAKVYEQIVSDLIDAQNLLLPAYPTSGPVRANKWAATALLARVYLYQKDWVDAEAQATLVINSGTYSLLTSLNSVFLASSKEAILQFLPVPGNNTSEGASFIPTSTTVKPTYALTTQLMAAFEPGDQRQSSWIAANIISGVAYNYPFKYKVRSSTTITENYMVLRLAEQYLIRAEARAQQNNASDAITDINVIRTRARAAVTVTIPNPLPNLSSTLGKDDVLKAVAKERQTEFFAEWGHRWFDLKRTNNIDVVLGTEKTGWLSTSALYPIPLTEIQKNPALTQNLGYQ